MPPMGNCGVFGRMAGARSLRRMPLHLTQTAQTAKLLTSRHAGARLVGDDCELFSTSRNGLLGRWYYGDPMIRTIPVVLLLLMAACADPPESSYVCTEARIRADTADGFGPCASPTSETPTPPPPAPTVSWTELDVTVPAGAEWDGLSPATIRLHSRSNESITKLETFLSAHLPGWEDYRVVDWLLKHLDQGTTPAGVRFGTVEVKLTAELSSYVLTVEPR